MTATFSQTGGVRIGEGLIAFNATWPLATLLATDTELRLKFFFKDYVFPKSSILRLSKQSGMFSAGLRIEHRVSSHPAFIVFWTFGFSRLKRELQGLGYEVGNGDT
jgi:hypothetical protein